MKYYIFFLIFLCGNCSCGQMGNHPPNQSKLVIRIINETLELRPGDKFLTLDVSVENPTDSSFILYDFYNIIPGLMPLSDHMHVNTTAENLIIGYNKKGDLQVIKVPNIENDASLIIDSVAYIENSIRLTAALFDKNKLIIEKRSTWRGKLVALCDQVRLNNQEYIETHEKIKIDGEYQILLVYHSGKNITNILSPDKIKQDEDRYNAKLFQGYVMSNTIRLVVYDK